MKPNPFRALTLSIGFTVAATAAGLLICPQQVCIAATPSEQAAASKKSTAQTLANANATASSAQAPWWKHAVFYEIYPRSFADSRDKGMGDLKGITAKLDYLHDLGISAIWLTPCYPSPQVDFGYDISDYETIAPEYGTLADFDNLVAEAKKRDIRIIMDLVLNHTSDKHKWFQESKSSSTNAKRDWYIWRDGAANGKPPNNWQACFGHSAWTLDPQTKQYYYHFFYPEQPDLNWRNKEVRKAMYDVARFWLDRGVAGFRLDAVGNIFEDPKLTDDPILPGKNRLGDPNMVTKYNENLPEVHDVMHELRQVLDTYPGDRVLIGECYGADVKAVSKFYGDKLDEVQLPMNFIFCEIPKLNAEAFRKQISEWDNNPAGGWPVYVLSNHDRVRHFDKLGDGKQNDEIAKLTAAMLLTLRGSPIMYYGEELGMQNRDPQRIEDVQDPIGKIGWPEEKGRDGERTPMQWSSAKNAGFSTAKPWLPVSENYKDHNVTSESSNPDSILNFYKGLMQLRKNERSLASGSLTLINQEDKEVLAYVRKSDDEAVIVAINMSPKAKTVSLDLDKAAIKSTQATNLLCSPKRAADAVTDMHNLTLEPYGAYIGRLTVK